MWSRYINLKMCADLSVESFLRAFQMHVHEFGMPCKVVSDSGTSVIAGSNIIKDFLKDVDTREYLQEHEIGEISFTQYYKGNSAQGSLVESAVKLVKKLIFGSINNIISYFDMEFLISELINIVNKRPVALKESLRDNEVNVPVPITPELLVHGYKLPTVNCIPALHVDDADVDYSDHAGVIKGNFDHLRKIRENLLAVYEREFLGGLFDGAVDQNDRYITKHHANVEKGDLVLLKEKFIKSKDYAIGIVTDTITNVLGETTGISVRKGVSREIVKRHVNSVVPLLQLKGSNVATESNAGEESVKKKENIQNATRPKRKSAEKAKDLIKQQSLM